MARQQGFHVLHFPVSHCELNPIERIWAQIKGEAATKNIMFRLKDVRNADEQCNRKRNARKLAGGIRTHFASGGELLEVRPHLGRNGG